MDENMLKALKEEEEHTFTSFNAKLAFEIGKRIAEYAIENNKQVCVDIFAYGKTLFHFASDKCIPDNDNWLRRKRNTVLYFGHSSKFISYKLNSDASLIASKYGKEIKDFAVIPGGFPIIVEGCGLVGAICVSGMKPEEDHQLVLDAISEVLKEA